MYRSLSVLLPHLADVEVGDVELAEARMRIKAIARTAPVSCPGCGQACSRVHSRYERRLADTAIGGRQVTIGLQVRRFICDASACDTRTFAEQVPGLTTRHARRTPGLRAMLESLAVVLAGRAGARLARVLGAATSRSTLLRLVRALPEPETTTPVVLGVDDFARKRGHVYGTVLIDMDTHRVNDMLEDREADSFAAWLRDHPGVEVVCRDRAGAYADGARTGAPEAIQVADRWHLWHNLAEHVEKTVVAHRGCLTEPAADTATDAAPADEGAPEAMPPPVEPPLAPADRPGTPDGLRDVCGRERRLVTRTRERYAAVHDLLAAGAPLAGICRALSLDRKTVQRFARATSVDQLLVKATNRANKLEPFKPYLHQRWNEGITNAAALHAELTQLGWAGRVQAVRRYVRPFRALTAAPPAAPAVPKIREIRRCILTHPDHLDTDEHATLDTIRSRCPHLDAVTRHVTDFTTKMTNRTGDRDHLSAWMSTVEADDLPHLHSFTTGLRRDLNTVINGLTTPHNSGPVEGTINKIKYIKRQMFGRANFDLLRKRVLLI